MAVVFTTPEIRSAWVMVWSALAAQVSVAPGTNVESGQATAPAVGSLTPTEVSVTVPMLVTTNDQATVSPTSTLPSTFTSVTEADALIEIVATGATIFRWVTS